MKKIILILLMFFMPICMAHEVSEQARILYASNDIKKAFELLLNIPEEERTAEEWLLMGNILQDQNKPADAIFMYNNSIATEPKNYKGYYNLGLAHLNQNQPNLAIEEFKKAIKYKSDFAYAYYNLGCAYLKIGKYNKAKWEFLNAITYNNQIADFHYNLAYTYKKLNNEKKARIYLNYYNELLERGQ